MTARTGVPIGGVARRTLFAWYFDDPNILLSRYVTGAEPDHVPPQHPGARNARSHRSSAWITILTS